jgi:sugar/nucleoside kinase (ribokinase family)
MEIYLANIDILKSDAVEAKFLTGETDIFKAAKFYASFGPKEIVLTHQDGLLIYADGKFHEFCFYPENLSGRSGRGDTCIGTYAAMRLTMEPLQAGMWAAAVTSLKMEKLGPFDRPICDVESFIQTHYNHSSIG